MKVDRRILIVEDETDIANAACDRLEREGYQVQVERDGERGLERSRSGAWDLIILDSVLPGLDGLEVRRELRSLGVTTPVLMLIPRDRTAAEYAGFRTGSDDYLGKPFEMIELVSRVEVLLRSGHTVSGSESLLRVGGFVLDTTKQQLVRGGEITTLSTQEYKLLRYLSERPGRIVTREELLTAVWGYDGSVHTRTVDVHIAWLRQKLDDRRSQSIIVTVRGQGYKLKDE